MRRRPRWRRPASGELDDVAARLATWPDAAVGGAARHMFALATIESHGAEPVRVAEGDEGWAAAVVFPGRLLVPCGDAAVIAAAAPPTRRWRLLVGDVATGDAVLSHGSTGGLIVHDQRFMTVDPARVPTEAQVPDPGLRPAGPADLDRLADLAVQLHVDDRFGPNPGTAGWRGYRQRLEVTTRQGMVWCVGPEGRPMCKVERSVSSPRWGVQLAGIVVDPHHRSEGLGRAAVTAAVRGAFAEVSDPRVVSLHVRSDNRRAIDAYLASGFVDREPWRLAVRP